MKTEKSMCYNYNRIQHNQNKKYWKRENRESWNWCFLKYNSCNNSIRMCKLCSIHSC